MRTSFIEDFIEWVNEALGDPGGQKRVTIASRLRDLHTHHLSVFERLLRTSSEESTIRFAETDIAIEPDREHYPFPGNFREFISLQRMSDDNRSVLQSMSTIPEWDNQSSGIKIVSPSSGFRIQPIPVSSDGNTWTYRLRYKKQPILLHYGTAVSLGTDSEGNHFLQFQPNLPEEQGTFVNRVNYYQGERIHIYSSATGGEGQSNEVVSSGGGLCYVRDQWQMTQDGSQKYEIVPVLPRGYDKLIALSVAMNRSMSRRDPEHWFALKREWRELFYAAKNYYRTTTSDRGSTVWQRPRVEVEPFENY